MAKLLMPKNNSITSVLIIGSGPIVIGKACEFDYSGTQAARSLREEGIKVILINSNPATIMTDPMMADRVYLLPLTAESIEQILEENEIDAVLPTMGGQTALNLCKEVDELGIWEKHNVQLIGVDIKAIDKAEDREKFRLWMIEMGIPVCPAKVANSFLEGMTIGKANTSATAYARMRSEALVLRAVSYYYLMSWFGDVPFFTKPLDPAEYETQTRKSKSEIAKDLASSMLLKS